MIPLHMGALHPFEQALTLLLAFGPFVVLGVVVWRRSKEHRVAADGSGESGTRPPREREATQRD